MGYYDGFDGKTNYASTHHVATLLQAPVILILDASKTSRSIAATALGFTKFHKNSRISGIILNKIGSKKHDTLCRHALENLNIPIIGSIPKISNNTLESRHLGLIPVTEQKQLQKKIKQVSKEIADYLDFEVITNEEFLSSEFQTRYLQNVEQALRRVEDYKLLNRLRTEELFDPKPGRE